MRTGEIEILIVPDGGQPDPDHWQSRWERNLRTARRIEPDEEGNSDKDRWVGCIIGTVATCTRPVVLVGHGLGVAAIAHASAKLLPGSIAGAFLVGPLDVDNSDPRPATARQDSSAHRGFAPMPLNPLPFPSRLIASSTDPYCSIERAEQFGSAWGSDLSVIANAGHLDSESGHGPWPEGLLTFGVFLKQLG